MNSLSNIKGGYTIGENIISSSCLAIFMLIIIEYLSTLIMPQNLNTSNLHHIHKNIGVEHFVMISPVNILILYIYIDNSLYSTYNRIFRFGLSFCYFLI